MIFRMKKYIDLDFREYLFNPDLKVLRNSSRMMIFLDGFNKYSINGHILQNTAKNLFEILVKDRIMNRILSTRLSEVINCGDFDRL